MLIAQVLRFLPAQVLAPIAQLTSVVLWTHWLAPAQMGVFTLVMAAQEIANFICLGWFSVYALRYMPRADDEPAVRSYLGTENAVVLGSMAASTLAGLVVALSLPAGAALWPYALAISANFATRAISNHYAERARAHSQFLAYSVLQTAGPVGAIGLGVLACTYISADALVLLWSYAIAQGAGCLLALPLLRMDWRRLHADRAMLRAAAAFGAPLFGIGLLSWLAENYIRYLVQWGLGTTTLGLMIVGWSLGRRGATVATGLVVTAAFPIASRLLNEGRRVEALQQLSLNAALVLAVLCPLAVGMTILGPALVSLVVAHEYRETVAVVLGWSVLGGVLRNLHMHTTDQLMVLDRRMKMLVAVNVFEIVACIAASLVGWKLWGLLGALAGQALGSALCLALSMALASSRLSFVWPWSESLRIAGASALLGAVLWWMEGSSQLLGLARDAAIGTLVYVCAMAVLFRAQIQKQKFIQNILS